MKNILITGASGGIGAGIARSFAEKNNRLLVVYNKNKAEIDKLYKELSSSCEIVCFKCDLTSEKQIKSMVDKILNSYKHIDCLINCAGVSRSGLVQDINEADYDFILNNNFKSTVMLTKYVAKNMISNKQGKIVNISSMWGVVGASMESLYSASKGAINLFTLSLAKELGPSNITVNAVCPGLIDTKMNAGYTKQELKEIINATPINRIGTSKDVGDLVEFLCSDKASFITGQIITIDGGLTL